MTEFLQNCVDFNDHHQLKFTSSNVDEIPTIDLDCVKSLDHLPESTLVNLDQILAGLISEIGDACEKWGIFQVVNHGIPQDLLERLNLYGRKFFALSTEEKLKVCRDEINPMGYGDEEWKQFFEFDAKESTVRSASTLPQDLEQVYQLVNRWPEYPTELREIALAYARQVEKLSLKLLQLIAMSLGLAANHLTDFHKDHSIASRLNRYLPCPTPDLVLGVGTHTDSGSLTILAQDDIGGLQVKRKSDGKWISVKPIPGALTINIGDVLQVWSNDKYHSVEHRVRLNSEVDRVSVASLFGPSYYVNVKPLEELIGVQNHPKYIEYNWGAFRASRLKFYGKKHDIERQDISQFRII